MIDRRRMRLRRRRIDRRRMRLRRRATCAV